MQTDTTALIEALERAEGPSRELDARIAVLVNAVPYDFEPDNIMPGEWNALYHHERWHAPEYTASIDAALTLADQPEDALREAMDLIGQIGWRGEWIKALPRFACIAALRAKGAQS